MILSNKKFEDVKDEIRKDLYEILLNRRKRVANEDKGIRENQTRKLCQIDSYKHLAHLLKRLEPYLRKNKEPY